MNGYFLNLLLDWKDSSINKKFQIHLGLYEHQYRVQL